MRKKLKPLVLFVCPISGLLKVCLAQYWLSITPPPSDNFPLDESSLRPKHGRGTGPKLHINSRAEVYALEDKWVKGDSEWNIASTQNEYFSWIVQYHIINAPWMNLDQSKIVPWNILFI